MLYIKGLTDKKFGVVESREDIKELILHSAKGSERVCHARSVM